MDEILKKRNLTYDDLSHEERETLNKMVSDMQKSQLTVEKISTYISYMKQTLENELYQINDVPTTWLSLLCFLIPFIGMVRKWYLDQHKLILQARHRNYSLLELILSQPDRAKARLDAAISNLPRKPLT